jgi:tetratricopeptide (TPR) repeat protein
MRLGTLLRFVRRFDQALAMIRKGHELEPQNPEWALMRATAEHDLGDKNLARRYYEETIRLATKAPAQGADTAWLQTLARKGLQNLNRGEPSFWADLYRDELPADDVLQRRGHFPPSRG